MMHASRQTSVVVRKFLRASPSVRIVFAPFWGGTYVLHVCVCVSGGVCPYSLPLSFYGALLLSPCPQSTDGQVPVIIKGRVISLSLPLALREREREREDNDDDDNIV